MGRGHVRDHTGDGAERAELGDGRLEPLLAAGGQHDARAFGGEAPCDPEPDPAARACDERSLSGEAEIHRRASIGRGIGSFTDVATTLYIVRHGETDWNRERRIQGHTDIPLNAEGRRQAEGLALELAATELHAAYASDLSRAWETAATVAEPRGLSVRRTAALREKHFGTWEGMTDDEVLARFPHAVNGSWGDGETTEQLAARTVAAVHEIARNHPGESVLVVSHGGTIRALYREAGVERPRVGNCTVATFVAQDGRLTLVDDA